MPALQYLAQKKLTGELLGQNGELLPAWKETEGIARWSSKLSCHLGIEEYLKLAGGYDPAEGGDENCFVISKVVADAGEPIAVCTEDIPALCLQVRKYHDEYCRMIEQWLSKAIGFKPGSAQRPECRMTLADVTWGGQYASRDHVCDYSMAYAMLVGFEDGSQNGHSNGRGFYDTIAHECCHAYQNIFTGVGTGHGGDFYGMMRHACGLPIKSHKHDYDVIKAVKVAKSLIPWWKRQMAKGVLASLACEVDTQFIKRAEVID